MPAMALPLARAIIYAQALLIYCATDLFATARRERSARALPTVAGKNQSHPPRMTATAQPLADTGERELP
jgi:hypothetical protein